MNTTSPVAEPKRSTTQAPRLLDQVVSNAEQNGQSHDAAVSMAGPRSCSASVARPFAPPSSD